MIGNGRTGGITASARSQGEQLLIEDFILLRSLVRERTLISLPLSSKKQVEFRLRKKLGENSLKDFQRYLDLLRSGEETEEYYQLIDAVTIKETRFFRNEKQFVVLETEVLPELLQATERSTLRIWSAACSTGEEAYSIAMVVDRFLATPAARGMTVEILASDLNREVVHRAVQGLYPKPQVMKDVPRDFLRYFQEVSEGWMQVEEGLRRRVTFFTHNLRHPAIPVREADIIFCRNVLIYFEPEARRQVLQRLHKALRPGGKLFLGDGETLGTIDRDRLFEPIIGKVLYYQASAGDVAGSG